MIRQATSADIAAIAATYEDLLTYEQEHGSKQGRNILKREFRYWISST